MPLSCFDIQNLNLVCRFVPSSSSGSGLSATTSSQDKVVFYKGNGNIEPGQFEIRKLLTSKRGVNPEGLLQRSFSCQTTNYKDGAILKLTTLEIHGQEVLRSQLLLGEILFLEVKQVHVDTTRLQVVKSIYSLVPVLIHDIWSHTAGRHSGHWTHTLKGIQSISMLQHESLIVVTLEIYRVQIKIV